LYLGSGEFWRLRAAKEGYYDAFWLGVIRYMAPPTAEEKAKEPKEKKRPGAKVLIIDGDPAGRKEGGDSYVIEKALSSLPKGNYEAVLADKANPVRALERDDLAKFGAVFLLNVRELNDNQLAKLEEYTKAGGGVCFFLGPNVSTTYYNKQLYKQGKGLF